jgi:hypothetical protein
MLYKFIIVLLLSTFEIYAAIGSGLAFSLSANQICLATLIGGVSGVFIAAFLGEKIRSIIAKYRTPKPKQDSAKDKLLIQLWQKYGQFGLGFIGSFLVGAPISIGIGYGFGVQPKELVKWCLVAVIIRSIAFSYFFNFIKNLF